MNQAVSNEMINQKYLWLFIILFVMFTGMIDWFDPRLIRIGRFVTDSGTLLAPITFLLGAILTDVYGFRYARKAIYYGMLFNLLFIIYGQIVIHLPGPNTYSMNHVFDKLFAFNIRIIIASVITYFISEITNAYLTSSLKSIFGQRYLTLRFLMATIIALGIDSFMFDTLAFYEVVSIHILLQMILLAWAIMSSINILGLPIAAGVAKRLK